MFKSIGFAIMGFIFLTLTSVMYLTKRKYHSLRNSLFKFLMFFALVMTMVEVFYLYIIKYTLSGFISPLFCKVCCRLFLFLILLWGVGFFFYIKNLNNDIKEKKDIAITKRKTYIKIFSTTIILWILSFFFNVNYEYKNSIYIITGTAVSYVYVIITVILIFLIMILIDSNYKNSIKMPIYFIILTFILTTFFNFCLLDINDVSYLLSFFVIGLYFTIESQDMMLLTELEEASKNAEILNKAKTEFLSNMSHEIRTPLNTILGFCQALLNDKELDKKRIEHDVKNINEASINLINLINNILDLSKIQSGKEVLYERQYNLKDILNELNNKIKEKYPNFKIKANDKMPSVYYGDSVKIIKLLHNLILSFNNFDENIVLSVDYTNQETSKLIFKIFTNQVLNKNDININLEEFDILDIGTKNNINSAILNIIVAKKLVEVLNGNIRIADDSIYEMSIAQKVINDKPIGISVFDFEIDKDLINCDGKKVLLIDDNIINLKLEKKILEKFKLSVTVAQSGFDCLKLVEKNKYDIIFLDHMMPNMDGVETLNKLKQNNLNLPVIIALTANSNYDSNEQYIKMGFDDYLSKPIDIDKLNRILKNHIK